jgi:hypothetical protein
MLLELERVKKFWSRGGGMVIRTGIEQCTLKERVEQFERLSVVTAATARAAAAARPHSVPIETAMAATAALTTINGVQGRFCTAHVVVCDHLSIPATALLFLSLPFLALPALICPPKPPLPSTSAAVAWMPTEAGNGATTAAAPAVTAEVESDHAADDGSGLATATQQVQLLQQEQQL